MAIAISGDLETKTMELKTKSKKLKDYLVIVKLLNNSFGFILSDFN